MYKKYKIFVELTADQIKQLQTAGIEVDSNVEPQEIKISTIGGLVSMTAMPVYDTFLYVRTPQQETLFNLLFTQNLYRLEEWCNDEYNEYAKFS